MDVSTMNEITDGIVISQLSVTGVRPDASPEGVDRTIHAVAPTALEYCGLDKAFSFYNHRLFDGSLPDCLITLSTRCRSARGYFCAQVFTARSGEGSIDEIALNPRTFRSRSDTDILSTLVHEMAHLWQQHFGRPGRRGYHNRQWADRMLRLGLVPSVTGEVGGRQTGERVTHYIQPSGPFDLLTQKLIAEGFAVHWESIETNRARQVGPVSKVKYACSACGQNAWAKPQSDLICGKCHLPLEGCDPVR
jgi:predicted SprT family Zn-dependent metalloprotease